MVPWLFSLHSLFLLLWLSWHVEAYAPTLALEPVKFTYETCHDYFHQHHYQWAAQCYERGLHLLQRSTAVSPEDALTAWNLAGRSWYEARRYPRSLACFQRALEGDPEDSQTHANIALSFAQLRRPLDAHAHLCLALASLPASLQKYPSRFDSTATVATAAAGFYFSLAEVAHVARSDCRTAVFYLRSGLQLDPRSAVFCYEEEAEVQLGKAVALDPKNAEYAVHWGRCLHALGRFEDAARAFQAALAVDGESVNTRNWLATCYYELGQYAAAEQVFTSATLRDDFLDSYYHYTLDGVLYTPEVARSSRLNSEADVAPSPGTEGRNATVHPSSTWWLG